jgi:hypothetical protein
MKGASAVAGSGRTRGGADLQRADGGWSQAVPEPRSDAFATGQTLYALAAAGLTADRAEVRRGIDFLVATQGPDGTWPMTARATPDGSPGGAKLLTPPGRRPNSIRRRRGRPQEDRDNRRLDDRLEARKTGRNVFSLRRDVLAAKARVNLVFGRCGRRSRPLQE